jgi:glutamate synthase (NADPH/NADH) large chain
MMRVCHLDTCPVGIATQNPELRKRFTGKPEFVETFFEYIAEEVREHLAELGFRTLTRPIGHVEVLDTALGRRPLEGEGARPQPILARAQQRMVRSVDAAPLTKSQDHGLDRGARPRADRLARRPSSGTSAVTLELPIRNVNRTVGTMLGHEVTKAHGAARACPTAPSTLTFRGRPGRASVRSCRAGITLRRSRAMPTTTSARACRAAGWSCGPTVTPPFAAEDNVIAGNVIGYGATSRRDLPARQRGGAVLRTQLRRHRVVEGVGDHGCEYMTGGRVVSSGPPAATSGRHVRRHRLRPGPRHPSGQPRDGRPRCPRHRHVPRSCARSCGAR